MSWNQSAPSGYGSYGGAKTDTISGNWYNIAITYSIARGSGDKVSVRWHIDCSDGQNGYAPTGWLYFNAGGNEKYYSWNSSQSKSRNFYCYNISLNAGSSIQVQIGTATSSGGTVSSKQTATLTGPAYTTTYTVSYSGNGSTSGSVSSQTKTYNTELTLQSNGYTRTGYDFTEWNTAADGSGTSYAEGGSYTANAAATMYAQWTLKTYTVSFDGNGADSGSMSSQTKYYGANLTLSANAFVKAGYSFTGWNTAADGSGTSYADGGSYGANASVTLYAMWKKNNIPLYANADGTVHQIEKAYINIGGVIKECTVYTNIGGVIKELS